MNASEIRPDRRAGSVLVRYAILGGSLWLAAGAHAMTGLGTEDSPYLVSSYDDLKLVGAGPYSLAASYRLANDIDASVSKTESPLGGHEQGFAPIGDDSTRFGGRFHGGGHVICHLWIDRPETDAVGLFGVLDTGSQVDSLGVVDGSVSGQNNVGGLAGTNYGTIRQCRWSGSVQGANYVGGLVGANAKDDSPWSPGRKPVIPLVLRCRSEGRVTGLDGGLGVGGLVGINLSQVRECFSSDSVNGGGGSISVGGLVGYNEIGGTVASSFATGAVEAQTFASGVGGAVGSNYGNISAAYSTGPVTSGTNSRSTGGLVGENGGGVVATYSTGRVAVGSNSSEFGGLVGNQWATIVASVWDKDASGLADDGTGSTMVGETTARMMARETFPGWDFENVWVVYPACTYPLLRAFLKPIPVVVADTSKVYDGKPFAGGRVVYPKGTIDSLIRGKACFRGKSQGAIHAGTYDIAVDSLYSNQSGYLLAPVVGAFRIAPAPLEIVGAVARSKVYDRSTRASVTGAKLSGVLAGDSVALSLGYAEFESKDTGTGKVVVVRGSTLSGPDSDDYTLAEAAPLRADIVPAPASIANPVALDKVYDGTDRAIVLAKDLVGVVPGDDVRLELGSASFRTKDTGSGKAVALGPSHLAGADSANYRLEAPPVLAASIFPARLAVVGARAADKIYDGTTVARIDSAALSGVVPGDTLSLVLGPANFATKDAGTGKRVVVSGSTISGPSAADYLLAEPADLEADIAPAPLAVSIRPLSKVYGNPDPVLSADYAGFVDGEDSSDLGGLVLARRPGENVGAYRIHPRGAKSANYDIRYATADLSITPRPVHVAAVDAAKAEGKTDPVLSYVADPLSGSDAWSGSLSREPGDTTGSYAILRGSLDAGPNYAVDFAGAVFTVHTRPAASAGRLPAVRRTTELAVGVSRSMAAPVVGPGQGRLGTSTGIDGAGLSVEIALASGATVSVSIFDNLGNPVISLSREVSEADLRDLRRGADGRWTLPVAWNLRSASGLAVPAGIYLWRIEVATDDGQRLRTVKKLGVGNPRAM